MKTDYCGKCIQITNHRGNECLKCHNVDWPMGVSQWKAHGIKYGYYQHFKDRLYKQAKEEQAKLFMSCLPEDNLMGNADYSDGFSDCISDFLSNAEKLGLINKKDV